MTEEEFNLSEKQINYLKWKYGLELRGEIRELKRSHKLMMQKIMDLKRVNKYLRKQNEGLKIKNKLCGDKLK